jgi:protein-S-isoprenylcysteine O-methyltransferase Ste14
MLQTRVPPPVYALLTGITMWLLDAYAPIVRLWSAPWNRAGWLLVAVGIGIDLWAVATFFRAGTTVNPLHPERTSRLITTGVYALTRNPMYLGLLLTLGGWACLLGSASPFALLVLFVWTITTMQILPEEKAMAERFGDAFTAYSNRVGRWIGWRGGR